MQLHAYDDALRNFKFFCRYMAFIDLDEFIFPKTNQSIAEVVDEILSRPFPLTKKILQLTCDGLISAFGDELKILLEYPKRSELLLLQKFLRLIK